MPYIEQCYRSNQARALRDIIIARAQALGESKWYETDVYMDSF